jgi:hypothetical protein
MPKARIWIASTLIAFSACSQAPDEPASGMTPTAAPFTASVPTPNASANRLYISNKQVSTDCGIDYAQDPPPGFARRPGQGPAPMPPPVAARVAVGADRPS